MPFLIQERAKKIRRRPTLPLSFPSSTIGAGGLNFRVRDGNGCIPSAIATGNWLYKYIKKYGQASRPISTSKLK